MNYDTIEFYPQMYTKSQIFESFKKYTDDYNTRSQHLCEKLGMRKEGFFKEFVSFVNNEDGTPHYENTYQYAILKKEWDALKK